MLCLQRQSHDKLLRFVIWVVTYLNFPLRVIPLHRIKKKSLFSMECCCSLGALEKHHLSAVKSTSGYCISSKFGPHHELQGVSPHYFILGLQGIQHHLPAPADTYIYLAHNCHPHINKR